MMLMRILGVWFLLGAMVALTIDGTKSLATGDSQWVITPLGEHWFMLHASSLNLAQAAIERNVAPWLWDPVIVTILQAPTWIVLGALGLLLYWSGRRRKNTEVFEN